MKRFVLFSLMLLFSAVAVFGQEKYKQGLAAMQKGQYQQAISYFNQQKREPNVSAKTIKDCQNQIAACQRIIANQKPSKDNWSDDSPIRGVVKGNSKSSYFRLGMLIKENEGVVNGFLFQGIMNQEGYSILIYANTSTKRIEYLDVYDSLYYLEGTSIHPEMNVEDLSKDNRCYYSKSKDCYLLKNNKLIRIYYEEDVVSHIEIGEENLVPHLR